MGALKPRAMPTKYVGSANKKRSQAMWQLATSAEAVGAVFIYNVGTRSHRFNPSTHK